MIYIEINTDNAAFDNNLNCEVLKILNGVDYTSLPVKIRDTNGNAVGTVSYINPKDNIIYKILQDLVLVRLGIKTIKELSDKYDKLIKEYLEN